MELELAPLPRTRSRPWPCAVSRAGSRLLVPPPFPSRPLKSFVRPPCLSPPAVLTTLPRARAPLLKAKEVLRAFSGLLLSSHHTLLCLPGSSVSIPAGEKYLSWLLCPGCWGITTGRGLWLWSVQSRQVQPSLFYLKVCLDFHGNKSADFCCTNCLQANPKSLLQI